MCYIQISFEKLEDDNSAQSVVAKFVWKQQKHHSNARQINEHAIDR